MKPDIASLGSKGVSKRLLAGDTPAEYAPPVSGEKGHLLVVGDGVLMAQVLDLTRLAG
jgi:hypothetical protein